MNTPFSYTKSLIMILGYKIRYGSKFSTNLFQDFNRIKLEIKNSGTLIMGKHNQNRGVLHLVVDGGKMSIGSHVFFNTGACISCLDSITLGDRVQIANNVVIVDHDHNVAGVLSGEPHPGFTVAPISIGENTWIGANSVILKGTTIGKNCVIAAGSIIKGNIPDGSIIIQKRETTIK